jgi:hypothetical protein
VAELAYPSMSNCCYSKSEGLIKVLTGQRSTATALSNTQYSMGSIVAAWITFGNYNACSLYKVKVLISLKEHFGSMGLGMINSRTISASLMKDNQVMANSVDLSGSPIGATGHRNLLPSRISEMARE